MYSTCIKETSEVCFHGCYCCTTPFLGLPEPQTVTSIATTVAASRYDFELAMTSSIWPNSKFTNHESLPSLYDCSSNFIKSFPQYSLTNQADKIREKEYYNLTLSNHVCLDYFGNGLFSYSQQQSHSQASTSTSPPPPPKFEQPFFGISYKAVSLNTQLQYSGPESDLENKIRKRIMSFMNISEDDYTMVFTANQSSAFKLLADYYPFQSHKNLLTVYDHESEAVKLMIESSKKKGAQVMSAEFLWPTLRIQSGKLQKKIASKKKTKKGLFVFPLQSRMTGNRYSYFWMGMAQENGWNVLLDACALGPKDMETLGLSLFKPDFLICSFYKVFGENPSGFGCLFVKKSSISILKDSATTNTSIGIVSLVPAIIPTQLSEELSSAADIEEPEIEELFTLPIIESEKSGNQELEYKGLDLADSLGLILISARARYLINWLVNALMTLHHPNSENGHPPVRIYGPKIKFDRGPAVAFNVFDWKGERIDPQLVQKLADRNNISLSCGYLNNIWFPDKNDQEQKNWTVEPRTGTSSISVVTAAIGFLTNFEDVYRLWMFVSRFLDADFVEKEKWRYTALNQNIVEV
ncbi:hypothetical protein JCGZ_20680 [Jatropha curcas]|uniref:Aminotransferase class V domain-containing protein n=1 Tax=Jatropha curcas TaxID=180498 RepID=A0A067K146_JATCU|nr:molybdenum cofactor sulfurase [Jatropha curcas]KDP25524.1 hypothetical protein JCGZ_20680 [Jatropha curcas]